MMLDLFDAPILPGLALRGDIIDAAEERMLIAHIDASDLTPFRFQGWTGKRLTTSFGWNYDFDLGRTRQAPPIPDWLAPFRDRAAIFAGLEPDEMIQALLIRYDPGAGIGWHRDRPQFGKVLGLSLGNPADLRLRRRIDAGRFERRRIPLRPRAAYLLDGPARWEWQHAILPVTDPRWSITFRSLRR